MGKPGLLTFNENIMKFDNGGFAMPITGVSAGEDAAYGKPPYHIYVENINIDFETDYDAVAPFLPAPLEFADENPVACVGVNNMFFTNFGTTMECYLGYRCLFEGEVWNYFPYWLIGAREGRTDVTAMQMGRELHGNGKKIADITLTNEQNIVVGKVSRPSNMPLFTATVSPQRNVELPHEYEERTIDLRYIPGLSNDYAPEVCQLVGIRNMAYPYVHADGLCDVWTGPASLEFHSKSPNDPWHVNKVNKILNATYGRYCRNIPPAFVMHDYLK